MSLDPVRHQDEMYCQKRRVHHLVFGRQEAFTCHQIASCKASLEPLRSAFQFVAEYDRGLDVDPRRLVCLHSRWWKVVLCVAALARRHWRGYNRASLFFPFLALVSGICAEVLAPFFSARRKSKQLQVAISLLILDRVLGFTTSTRQTQRYEFSGVHHSRSNCL